MVHSKDKLSTEFKKELSEFDSQFSRLITLNSIKRFMDLRSTKMIDEFSDKCCFLNCFSQYRKIKNEKSKSELDEAYKIVIDSIDDLLDVIDHFIWNGYKFKK